MEINQAQYYILILSLDPRGAISLIIDTPSDRNMHLDY